MSMLYPSVVSSHHTNVVSCIGILSCKYSILYVVWLNNKCHVLFGYAHNT